jgi:hypothetical protein
LSERVHLKEFKKEAPKGTASHTQNIFVIKTVGEQFPLVIMVLGFGKVAHIIYMFSCVEKVGVIPFLANKIKCLGHLPEANGDVIN